MQEEDGLNFNFWATEIKVNGITTVKLANGNDALHLTMACFGEKVEEKSRTVLYCKCNEREAPIAVLMEGLNENQQLDLMVSGNDVCEFSLKGRSPSSVYLSGFIQPLVDAEDLGNVMGESVKEDVRGDQEEETGEESNSSMGGLKRQLAAPDRPKKKAKSAEPSPTATSKSVLTDPDNSMDAVATDVEVPQTKQPEPTKPMSPESSQVGREPAEGESAKKKKKKKSKFTYDEMGLGVRTVKKGTGPAVSEGDTVRIRYIGQLAGKKSIFDKNLTDGFTFTVGEGKVVKGLERGLLGMKKDEKRKLMIPSQLAYGSEGDGSEIPADADLLFTVELLEVV